MQPITDWFSSTTQQLVAAQPLLPLFIAAGGIIVAVAAAAYIVLNAPVRARNQVAHLMSDYDALTQKLSEAEKIGHFGSFTWDFQDETGSFWSEEMYNLFGLVRRNKPPGTTVLIDVAHPEDKARVKEVWEKLQSAPGPFSFDFRAVAPNGQERYVRVQGKTLIGSDQGPLRVQGVVHDITKEMEIDKAKTEFVSLASHQLKTPLTSVKWLSELLLRPDSEPLTDSQKEYVNNIHAASQNMMSIVNDLLNVSRIELGTLRFILEEFDVCELMTDAINEQMPVAQQKKLTVNVHCESGMPKVKADKNMLRMIFQNLISNAIKYTPDGGSVECEVNHTSAAREMVFVRVTDTGIGIPKSERDNMFKKLYRAKNAMTQVPDGTGLGLYVIKIILERARGAITFESKEGEGTTFYASFPFVWEDRVDKRT